MRLAVFVFVLCFNMMNTSYAQKEFWGSASRGGANNNGFIFKTDSIGNNLVIVHQFQQLVDGDNISALTLGSNHKLYGVASSGGLLGGENAFAGGTLFEYDLATDQFRVLEHFGAQNTKLPLGMTTPRAEGVPNLYEISPGIFYVLMSQGRVVYAYDINTGVFTQPFSLPTYKGGASNGTLPNKLNQAFYKAADGFLYVSTPTNSMCPIPNPNMGSIMRLNPANNTLSILHRANCQGIYGLAYHGFFAELNGKLYSTTNDGGANYKGVLYSYTPASNTFTKLHDFTNSVYSNATTALVVANNGKLYGTAHGGGTPEPNLGLTGGAGMLYEFDLTTNTFTKKHDFTLTGQSLYDMGVFPSGLISSSNGKLYGTTQYGVFEYDPVLDEIRKGGRFEVLGFAPSLLQVCRKPAYQALTTTTYALCEGSAFTTDLASTNSDAAVWRHDHVIDATQTTPVLSFSSFTPADAGTWVCTLSNECGETTTQTITLTLSVPPAPAISVDGALVLCEGETVTLTAPSDYTSYAWSSGQTSQQITVSEGGDYSVKVNDGCESPTSESISVTVHPLPPAPDGIISTGNILTAVGETGNYRWMLDDLVLPQNTSVIEATESGLYSVYSLSTTGCRSATFASMSFVVTSNEVNIEDDVIIYPNPGHGVLHLTAKQWRGHVDISVFNATGSMVHSQALDIEEESTTFYLDQLPAGVYAFMIQMGNRIIMKKVVIQ